MIQSAINLSEGRNQQFLSLVQTRLEQQAGVILADLSMDPDHHRMVVSLLGQPLGLTQAILALFELAEAHLDLSQHQGVHPRVGAVDVVPLVPLGSTPLEEVQALAQSLALQVAKRFQVPVWLYEDSATSPERRDLPEIRRRGLTLPPDFGPQQLHPRLGGTVIGARRPLIAFNVLLDSQDLALGKAIAKELRSLASVRCLAFWLESQQKVQISFNLTDLEQVGIQQIHEAVERLSAQFGTSIHSCELIGLAPARSFVEIARHHLKMPQLKTSQLLEWNCLGSHNAS